MYSVRTDAPAFTCGTVVKPHNRKRDVVLLRGGFSYEVTVRYAPQKEESERRGVFTFRAFRILVAVVAPL